MSKTNVEENLEKMALEFTENERKNVDLFFVGLKARLVLAVMIVAGEEVFVFSGRNLGNLPTRMAIWHQPPFGFQRSLT